MTRIDEELSALSETVAHDTTGPAPEDVVLAVHRSRRRRRGALASGLGGLSLAVAVTAGVVDWSALRPAPSAPAEAPAVVEPLAGDTIQCGTPESDIVPTTTLTLTDVSRGQVEVTNRSSDPFFAASNGTARTVLVQDGRVVAMTLAEVQPLVPVDVGPGDSQVLGVAGAQSCSGIEGNGPAAAPVGTYTAYRVLPVDELSGPDALDTWDGTDGTPVTIVSAPFELEIVDSFPSGAFECGASVPDNLVVKDGLQLVSVVAADAPSPQETSQPGDQQAPLSLFLHNGTGSSVTVGGSGWSSVVFVHDGVVVARTIGVQEPVFQATLAPYESAPVSFELMLACPEFPFGVDPSEVVAYGSLDISPATGTTLDTVVGGPWRVSAADLSSLTAESPAMG
ncbi:hypothetical protein EQW78_06030 [Oerskovia turbata]|uniref:Uncharacterized protein n=1 Tax=Oerskovia turbata TaxID=1713 RepID=A0A4Q1KY09_9CELL|nr:hypothetical protein [Oerskovia turbata]RXR25016.1 hypothetical protein EQW73_12060 [Oerskovia turbata]RXR35162.1 hypothetical protein EQW78_06030 [Oerskovia turbata]TGJ96406.1 hypothetical protein DLJ96_11915 [Actinotalea fermentans ATCC 43279 = JCM 9966 = DSM 3133]